jgi:hypothetical protein
MAPHNVSKGDAQILLMLNIVISNDLINDEEYIQILDDI